MCRALALGALLLSRAAAQPYTPGAQVLTFLSPIDDSDQPYALYLPNHYDPGRKYPLVISLHGEGSNHRLNLRRVFGMGNLAGESDAEASRYFPRLREVDYIVASPYARGSMDYQGVAEADVYEVLADVKRRFSIDDDRVYLTGLSMGGGGALWLALTRPDVWAAVAAVCPSVPPGTEALAANALDLPVHLFHGERDPTVPVDVSRSWHKRLVDLGVQVEYVEYPGVRHNAWENAYRGGAIFDWFDKFRRNRFPDRVRFNSSAYKYGSAYWIRMDSLTPGTPGSIDAKFTGRNRIDIVTHNLDGFTLVLEGHPEYAPGRPLAVTIDGTGLRRASGTSFSKTAKGWRAVPYARHQSSKGPGAEGPLAEAIAARHIYVYGTADNPGEHELTRRRGIATEASEWSRPRARLLISFAVKADTGVTSTDIRTSNLVLFGTRETNRVIARFADRLPLAMNPGAADYGLVFMAAVDGHYLVVNSGLPWWTGADRIRGPGLHQPPAPFQVLERMGDFLLFKGSLENVVAEGRFDRDWRLPPEAAARMSEVAHPNVP